MSNEISAKDLYNGNFKVADLDIVNFISDVYRDGDMNQRLASLAHGCRFDSKSVYILYSLFLCIYGELIKLDGLKSEDVNNPLFYKIKSLILDKEKEFEKDIDNLVLFNKKFDIYKELLLSYFELIIKEVIESASYLIINNRNLSSVELINIFDVTSNSNNDNIRMYCCANIPINKANDKYFNSFLNDSNERIKKICNIRLNFENNNLYKYYYSSEREQIEFIRRSLEINCIKVFDQTHLFSCNKEIRPVFIFSTLFVNDSLRSCEYNALIDRDILYTISDKRILAKEINDLILDGKIKFNDFSIPVFYKGGRSSMKNKVLILE